MVHLTLVQRGSAMRLRSKKANQTSVGFESVLITEAIECSLEAGDVGRTYRLHSRVCGHKHTPLHNERLHSSYASESVVALLAAYQNSLALNTAWEVAERLHSSHQALAAARRHGRHTGERFLPRLEHGRHFLVHPVAGLEQWRIQQGRGRGHTAIDATKCFQAELAQVVSAGTQITVKTWQKSKHLYMQRGHAPLSYPRGITLELGFLLAAGPSRTEYTMLHSILHSAACSTWLVLGWRRGQRMEASCCGCKQRR